MICSWLTPNQLLNGTKSVFVLLFFGVPLRKMVRSLLVLRWLHRFLFIYSVTYSYVHKLRSPAQCVKLYLGSDSACDHTASNKILSITHVFKLLLFCKWNYDVVSKHIQHGDFAPISLPDSVISNSEKQEGFSVFSGCFWIYRITICWLHLSLSQWAATRLC